MSITFASVLLTLYCQSTKVGLAWRSGWDLFGAFIVDHVYHGHDEDKVQPDVCNMAFLVGCVQCEWRPQYDGAYMVQISATLMRP